MLRRPIAVRNWLPEPGRVSADRTIPACRRKGIEIAPAPLMEAGPSMAAGLRTIWTLDAGSYAEIQVRP